MGRTPPGPFAGRWAPPGITCGTTTGGLRFATGGLGFTTGGLGFTTGGLGFTTGGLTLETGGLEPPGIGPLPLPPRD